MEGDKLHQDKKTSAELLQGTQPQIAQNISYEEYHALKQGFVEERKKMEDRMWLDSNLRKFDELLRQNYDSSVKKFSENVITYLSKTMQAVYGAFFIVDNEKNTVEAVAGYACTVDTMDRVSFKIGEGLVGQVAKSKEMICVDDLETQLDSALGRMNASYLVVSPLLFNQSVYGILEITTLSKLKPRNLILIERVSRNIAASLQSLLHNQATKELLIESLQQAEDYKAQKKILVQKEKEINTIKEELQRKEVQLKEFLNNHASLEYQIPHQNGIVQEQKTTLQELEINALQDKMEIITVQLKEKEAQLTATLQELQQQKEEVINLVSNTISSDKIGELEKEIQNLREQLQQKEETAHLIVNDTITGLEKEIQNLREQLQQKEEEIKNTPEPSNEVGFSIEELTQRCSDLENQLQKKIQDLVMSKEAIKWKDAEIDRQDDALVEKKRALKTVQNEIKQHELENLKNVEEIVRQGKLINQLEEKLQQQEANIQQAGRAEEIDALSQKLKVQEEENQDFKMQLDALVQQKNQQEEEFGKLKVELQKKELTIGELEEKSGVQESLFQQIEELQSKLRKKEDELLVSQYLLNQKQEDTPEPTHAKTLQNTIEEQEQTILELREQLSTWKEKTENSSERNDGQLLTLQEQLTLKDTEIKDLKQHIEQSEVEKEQVILGLQEQLNTLKERIGENPEGNGTQISSLQEQLGEKEEELEHLRKNVEQAEQTTQQLQEQLTVFKEKAEQNPEENDEQVSNLQKLLSKKEEELEELRVSVEQANVEKEKIENLQSQLLEKQTQIENLQETQNTPANTEELNNLITDLHQKESENLQQTEALNKLRSQLLEKEKTIGNLQEEVKNTQQISLQEYESFNQKLQDLEIIQNSLKSKEEELIQKTEKLQKQKVHLLEQQKDLEESKDSFQNTDSTNSRQLEVLKSQESQLIARQQEMVQKEKELGELFNKINNSFASMEIDMNGTILSINNKFLMSLGLKVADIEQQPYESILDKEYVKSSTYKLLWHELKMGISQTVEDVVCVGNKNKKIFMTVTYIPIMGEQGPYEIVKLVNHIKKPSSPQDQQDKDMIIPADTPFNIPQKETVLSYEEKEKMKILEGSFPILDLDLDGNIVDVNRQFLIFLGYDKEEVERKHHSHFLDDSEKTSEEYQEILENMRKGFASSKVFKYVGKEGELVRLRSFFNPIKDSEEQPLKVMVVSQFVN